MLPFLRAPYTPARGVCSALGLALALGLGFQGCRAPTPTPEREGPAEALDRSLAPRELVRALASAGGAHVRATTRFFAQAQAEGAPDPDFAPAQDVTTETELWLDKAGDYRLVERNDQDGGREIVRKGGALFVALRYGKRVQRAAREPEIGRYLEEAVGGPWAAWELARAAATVTVEPASANRERFSLSLAPENAPGRAAPAETGLRAWRTRTRFLRLSGTIVLRTPEGLVESAELEGAFFTDSAAGAPDLAGGFAVRLSVTNAGATSAIDTPDAEPLPHLQRTLLEERLLDGLPGRRDPAQPPSQGPVQNKAGRPAAASPSAPSAVR